LSVSAYLSFQAIRLKKQSEKNLDILPFLLVNFAGSMQARNARFGEFDEAGSMKAENSCFGKLRRY